jgi:Phage lysozyme.
MADEAVVAEVTPNIEGEEGLRLYVYDDANGQPIVAGYSVIGNPTIGYGRLLTSAHGITQAEAGTLLMHDVAAAEGDVSKMPVFAHLNVARQAALLDMDFNMGFYSLEQFTTFLGLLASARYDAAADDLKATLWAGEVGQRATRIEQIIRTGIWVKAP